MDENGCPIEPSQHHLIRQPEHAQVTNLPQPYVITARKKTVLPYRLAQHADIQHAKRIDNDQQVMPTPDIDSLIQTVRQALPDHPLDALAAIAQLAYLDRQQAVFTQLAYFVDTHDMTNAAPIVWPASRRWHAADQAKLQNILANIESITAYHLQDDQLLVPVGAQGLLVLQGLSHAETWLQQHATLLSLVAGLLIDNQSQQLAQQLQAREAQLQLFTQHSPVAMAILDDQLNFVEVSDRWLHDFRLKPEAILGRSCYQVFPDLPHRWRVALEACLTEGVMQTCDEDTLTRRGRDELMRWEIRPWQNNRQATDTRGLIVFVELLTEKKRTENKLARQLDVLESLESIDRIINRTYDLSEMIAKVMQQVLDIFNADRAWLLPTQHQAQMAAPITVTEVCKPGIEPMLSAYSSLCYEELEELQASDWAGHAPLSYGDEPGFDYPLRSMARASGACSQLAMMVTPKQGAPWQLGLQQCYRARHWNDDEQRIFRDVGHRLADGLSLTLFHRDLQASQARLKDYVDAAADWFWEMDADQRFVYVSDKFQQLTGINRHQILGKTLKETMAMHAIDYTLLSQRAPTDDQPGFYELEFSWVQPDGRLMVQHSRAKALYNNSQLTGYRGIGRDITESYQLSEQLSYQATHDVQTGLLNRHAFYKALGQILQTDQQHVFCYLDLDQFKIINDACGHAAGDELLTQLSHILRQKVRPEDILARLGGDEFGLLLTNSDLTRGKRTANQIRRAIEAHQFRSQGQVYQTGVSVGLVVVSRDDDPKAVMSAADAACSMAEEDGRNRIHIYNQGSQELVARYQQISWVRKINHALDKDLFILTRQPIVPINTNDQDAEGEHFEILVRMIDTQGQGTQLISPNEFIPAAERYQLMPKLDRWVIRKTIAQLTQQMHLLGNLDNLHLCSINLSGQSLSDELFHSFIVSEFYSLPFSAEKLCFEITETAAIANMQSAIKFVNIIKSFGCKISLDDFGTGLSSFNYLKNLPVDYIKVDGMFIRDITNDPVDLAMVKSISDVSRMMGKEMIAEYVESQDILDKLQEIGVHYAQGYAIGKPERFEVGEAESK